MSAAAGHRQAEKANKSATLRRGLQFTVIRMVEVWWSALCGSKGRDVRDIKHTSTYSQLESASASALRVLRYQSNWWEGLRVIRMVLRVDHHSTGSRAAALQVWLIWLYSWRRRSTRNYKRSDGHHKFSDRKSEVSPLIITIKVDDLVKDGSRCFHGTFRLNREPCVCGGARWHVSTVLGCEEIPKAPRSHHADHGVN